MRSKSIGAELENDKNRTMHIPVTTTKRDLELVYMQKLKINVQKQNINSKNLNKSP